MCGITGWVDFARGMDERRALIEDMTEGLRNRGPDASGIWIEGPVALGHRRLAIIDLPGGKQPMLAEAGGSTYSLTFSGEIYNFRELRRELAGRGHAFETASDTEVLLRAYLEWGVDCVGRFDGMFAFGLWDGRRRQLVLGRDRFGIKPLYYADIAGAGVVFGSEPKCILASRALPAAVDSAGLREILDMVKRPGAAVFRGMRELRPGHLLIVDADGAREQEYWRLVAHEHNDSLVVTIDTVRDLLRRVVSDQLVSDVPICTLLSGGLDSSAITAITADVLGAEGTRSFSVDFRSSGEGFAKDAVRNSPDSPFARELADYIGTDHHEILLDGDRLMDPDVRARVLAATDLPPAYWGDMWPSLLLLFEQVKLCSTVAVSGEGADELFGGYQWFFNDNATAGDGFPWLTRGSSRYFGGSKLFDRGFLAGLDIEEARAQSYSDALAAAPRLDGESDAEARMRMVSYLNLTRFMQTLLDRKDRMSMAVGLEVRVPFCDHRLVEYVFNVPWAMKSFDGREKSLLREAMREALPASILDRRKNPYPAIQDMAYEDALRAQLADIVHDSAAPILPLLDKAKVQAELGKRSGGVSLPYARGSLELCVWLNAWLTRYSVELVA